MKKKIIDKIILKAGAALLSFGILLGSAVWGFPVQVSAADLDHDHANDATLQNAGNSATDEETVFDPFVTPTNVEGKLHMGTSALKDPVAKEYNGNGVSGTYYEPQTYVYFGSAYSSAEKRKVPIILRVLDADKDNAGNGGAMFVMTEQASTSNTIFSYYRQYDDTIWYGMYATENVYNLSIPYEFVPRIMADYYLGDYKVYFENLGEELDYIRPVTVVEKLAALEGLYGYGQGYGYSWELDSRSPESEVYAQDNDQIAYIDNERFFPLSAEEMSKYVSTVPYAPGMATTMFGTDTPVTYWLRTGLDYPETEAEKGNWVGAVDGNGNVIPLDTGEKAYIRYGFNIETGDIQFMYELAPNTYRLTFIDPTYKAAIENADPENGVDDRFKASVLDVKDGLVTLEISNAIRNRSNTSYGNLQESIGVSVIIKDKNGNVTHYGNIDDYIYGEGLEDPSAISATTSKVYFRLPKGLDYTEHEVYVFWEMTQDEPGGATFISNMVKLDCLHPEATKANCIKPAVCPTCGEFGDIDKTYHEGVDTSVYYTDTKADIHWNVCTDCNEVVNEKECTFGDDCSVDCICGNSDYPPEKHVFDDNGICEVNENHFESPTYENNDNLRHSTVRIANEGQLISFAKAFNSGDIDTTYDFSVFIENDLDFSYIDGFEPIGTEEHPFTGYLSGKNFTVRDIVYSTSGKYAGIFGVVSEIDIRYLNVVNCSFEAEDYAGILVGKSVGDGSYTAQFDTIEITGCTVNATEDNGKEGILIGEACDNVSVYNVYSVRVENSDGHGVRFFSDPELYNGISVRRSACLYGERGEYGEYDADAYASGEVAHLMGKGQKIGEDEYPSTDHPSIEDNTRVFKVSDCSGEVLRYTNEYLSIHHLKDYTEHRITKFHEFVWDEYLPVAEARVYCDACKQDIFITAEMTMEENYAPVRCDYVANVVVNGEKYSSDPKRFIGIKIQDMIGMTNKTVEFNGNYVSTEYVLDNYLLVDSPAGMAEFEAYFLDPVTGEKLTELQYDYYGKPVQIPKSVYLPGSYDLLVVGKRAYEGQEYVYEDVLTITPITINVTVADIYKYWDGSASFEPVFTADNENYEYILTIKVTDAPSADAGIYDLDVGVEFWDDSYAKGVEVIFSRDSVKGYIFPALKPYVENVKYPTEFTYGDILPDPSSEHFTVNEGCKLEFDWLEVEYDTFGDPVTRTKLDSKPQHAGKYMLRVTAVGEGYVNGIYEFPIEIKAKELTLKIDGAEIVTDEYDREIYVVEMHQMPAITVEGFVNGDTVESEGVFITYYQSNKYNKLAVNDLYKFPYQPDTDEYQLTIYGDLENYLIGGCDYERAHDVIYVKVRAPEYPTPVSGSDNLEDGEKQEFGVVYSWDHPVTLDEDRRVFYYGRVTKDGGFYESFELDSDDYSGDEMFHALKLTDAGEYNVNITAQYAYGEDIEGYDVNVSFTVGIATADGEMLDDFSTIGDYIVTVTSSDGTVRETPATVRREIHMEVKPFEYELSEGYPEFDIRNYIMQAGKVVLLGHEIVDVSYDFNSRYAGINVNGLTVVDQAGRDVSHLYAVEYSNTDIHVFDSPCDAECNIYGCEYVRAARHTGGTATCNSLAVCEECGNEYGNLQPYNHTAESTVCSPSVDDKMVHNLLYTCCGAIKSSEGHTPAVAATCTSLAICADCNWAYGEFDLDNHSSEEMHYAPSSEFASLHVATHVCCKASFTEEHEGGKANCVAQAICEKCNTSYGEIDPDHHVNVTYNSIDSTLHGAKCNDCSVEWQEAHTGGSATCKTLAVCEHCKASYGEYDKDNHESDETKYVIREENPSMHDYVHSCCGEIISKAYHSGGEANCASAAICEYCKEQYGNKDPSVHASEEFTYKQDPNDPASHIKQHACCNENVAIEAHTGEGSANCEHGNICGICGIEYTDKLGHTYDDEKDTRCNVCGKEVASEVIEPIKNNKIGGGCKGAVGIPSAIMITVGVILSAISFKKKED